MDNSNPGFDITLMTRSDIELDAHQAHTLGRIHAVRGEGRQKYAVAHPRMITYAIDAEVGLAFEHMHKHVGMSLMLRYLAAGVKRQKHYIARTVGENCGTVDFPFYKWNFVYESYGSLDFNVSVHSIAL